MKTVFIVSDGLSTLDRGMMNRSSHKYEYDLAVSMSKSVNVKILSAALEFPEVLKDGNLQLFGIRKGGSKYSAAKEIINQFNGEKSVIFWGYDFFKVLIMLQIQNKCNAPVFPFVYDSHKVAISNFNPIKRLVADLYFKLGKMILKRFHGIILFQEKAAKLLSFDKRRYLVIKPGAPKNFITPLDTDDSSFNVVFCGTLSHLNGVDSLIETFDLFENSNIRFTLCGDGPLSGAVREASEHYDNVEYLGLVSDNEIRDLYSRSDLLLNLRRTDDEAMNYAFPSKFFESICSGVPVVTPKLIDDFEINDNVYIINKISAGEISETIFSAYDDRSFGRTKALKARNFALDKYSFDKSASNIIKFIFND